MPATTLYLALGVDADERVNEAIAIAAQAGIALVEMTRGQMDKMTGRAVHQGLALQVPPYTYLHPDDLLALALEATRAAAGRPRRRDRPAQPRRGGAVGGGASARRAC